jgi:hypothetical protein
MNKYISSENQDIEGFRYIEVEKNNIIVCENSGVHLDSNYLANFDIDVRPKRLNRLGKMFSKIKNFFILEKPKQTSNQYDDIDIWFGRAQNSNNLKRFRDDNL